MTERVQEETGEGGIKSRRRQKRVVLNPGYIYRIRKILTFESGDVSFDFQRHLESRVLESRVESPEGVLSESEPLLQLPLLVLLNLKHPN